MLTTDMDGQSYFEFQQYFRQRQGWKLASFTFFTLLLLVVVEVFAVRSMVPPVAEAILLGIAAFVLVALAALVLLHQAYRQCGVGSGSRRR
ncbi:hypothetical protein JCM19237_3316 [Photobacterium aphoticum]|uniref:Uncharacterized protein n=1 Tax=Photobacterium aphoticum TaxID=754436 RepID=A0A090RIM2_9GAMM|nr:hypothetical protein JCM19237_3316 [Photobacterium aphoticum]